MARMHYSFDLELLDPTLDWDKESKSSYLWMKPDLLVRFHKRECV